MADFLPPALRVASNAAEKAAIIADFALENMPECVSFVARRCIVLHWFNRAIVKAILQDQNQNTQSDHADAEGIYQQLCSLPFIEVLPWGCTFQDLTREGLLARYATTRPKLLKDGARIAATVYKMHKEGRKILAEALFCTTIVGDREEGASLLEKLLTESCEREDWRYIRNIFNLQKEAEQLPFVLPLPRSKQQLLLQSLVHKVQSKREVGTDKLFSGNARIAQSSMSQGTMHAYQKHFKRAIADYNRAIQADSALTQAYINRGIVYQSRENYNRALQDFSAALQHDTDNSFILLQKGAVLNEIGRHLAV